MLPLAPDAVCLTVGEISSSVCCWLLISCVPGN